MNWIILFLTATALLPGPQYLSTSLPGQLQPDKQAAERDLSRYSVLGPITLGHTPELRRNLERNKSLIRKFVWEFFKNSQLAHLRFLSYSLEGNKIENLIFIEPDEKGIWHVHVESISEYQSYGAGKEMQIQTKKSDAYTLLRVVDPGYGKKVRILSDSDSVPPDGYVVRLLDRDGKTLMDL
jgi:hypothetical protein